MPGNVGSNQYRKRATDNFVLTPYMDYVHGRVEDMTIERRKELANNPKCASSILAVLAKEKSYVIRRSVAWNPNTLPETLSQLAKDPYKLVRIAVARNLHTPPEDLARLCTDKRSAVREMALDNLNLPNHIKAMKTLGT